jgi:hypothetical protein
VSEISDGTRKEMQAMHDYDLHHKAMTGNDATRHSARDELWRRQKASRRWEFARWLVTTLVAVSAIIVAAISKCSGS